MIIETPESHEIEVAQNPQPHKDMNLRRIIIHAYLYGPYLFHRFSGTGAFGRPKARYIDSPIPSGGNSLKAALIRHHVKQFHESSCSVASVVSVVNAIRDVKAGGHPPITQRDILEEVRTGHWKERMSDQGHNGRRGLPLPLLGEIVESSLDAYRVPYAAVETVQAQRKPGLPEEIKATLRRRLFEFETRGNGLIIAHFDQGALVPVLNIPHISPVGGFDTQSGDVIVLDVDPEQKRPYSVTFDTFCKSLFSNYNPMLKLFGYISGGYVYIKL